MRLLLSVFFPRSIHMEGIHTLVDSLATSFVQQGVATTLLAPLGNTKTSEIDAKYDIVDYLPDRKVSIPRMLLLHTQAMQDLVHQFDVVQLVDVAPSYLLLSERWARRASPVYSLIEGPGLSWSDLRGQRLSVQHLSHWVLKNHMWARLLPHHCEGYVVSSSYQQAQLQALNIQPDRIRVVPFGIHPDRIRPFDRQQARQAFEVGGHQVVGYLGHYSPMKGVPVLLAAFEQVALQNPAAKLLLAWSGKGAESQKVLSTLEQAPYRHQVKLVGEVSVPQFLAACDVIALPYLGPSIPHFPLVLIEAFAARVPVVTTRVGGLPEVVQHEESGMLVEAGSSTELAQALMQLLEDGSLRSRLSENAHEVFGSLLNSNVTAKGLLELYRKGI